MSGRRGEVWFVEPDFPIVGSEIEKTRPWVIVQPPEMDRLRTTIAVPLTSRGFNAPYRVPTTFGTSTFVLCDHIKSIDRQRLRSLAGEMNESELSLVLRTLQTLFTL